jgi:hypothetical protein
MPIARLAASCLPILCALRLVAVVEAAPQRAPSTTLLVESDVDCSVRVDGRLMFRVSAARPLPIPVSPGAHRIEASRGTLDHIEQRVTAAPGTTTTVRVELVSVVRQRLLHSRLVALADERAAALTASIAARDAEASEAAERLAAARRLADERTQASLTRIRAVIGQIRELDRRMTEYSAVADRQAGEARALKVQADAQNAGTTFGAVAGLLGNIAAASGSRDARRTRLRADATLRRIDRLTAMLSVASDRGFDALPEPGPVTSVFAVTRKKTPGTLTVSDNRLEYRDADGTAAALRFAVTCADLKSAKGDQRSVTVKTTQAGVALQPSSVAPDIVVGEILLACPDKEL